MHDDTHDLEHDDTEQTFINENGKVKPHILRRNIEDYLEKKALEKRLKEVFDEDFVLD